MRGRNDSSYWESRMNRRFGRRRMLMGSGALMAGGALALLGCSSDDSDGAEGPSTGGTPQQGTNGDPKPGGRIGLVRSGNTENLNVITDTGQRLNLGAQVAYDRLLTNFPGKDYTLQAAESVELPDETTVVFKLKPSNFHDVAPVNGRAVTSEDVAESNYYVRDNERAINRTFQTQSMEDIESPDDQTVIFNLTGPNAYLFSGTQLVDPGASCIFPREILGDLDTLQIGSGPYQLGSHELGIRYQYDRYEGFREEGLPYIDERDFTVFTDDIAIQSAFRGEQVQLWQLPNFAVHQSLQADMASRVEFDEYESLGSVSFQMNSVFVEPFADARVREAFYRAINRQEYVDLVANGRGKVQPGPIPTGLTEYQLDASETAGHYEHDPATGRQLLEAAGFPFDREFAITSANSPAQNQQFAEILTRHLSTIGVRARGDLVPFPEWLQGRIPTGDWEMWMASLPGWDTPATWLRLQHTQTNFIQVYGGLKDPEVDALIEESEVTIDPEENIRLVKEIQRMLLDRYTPFFLIYDPTTAVARYSYVRDFEPDPSGNPNSQARMWLNV